MSFFDEMMRSVEKERQKEIAQKQNQNPQEPSTERGIEIYQQPQEEPTFQSKPQSHLLNQVLIEKAEQELKRKQEAEIKELRSTVQTKLASQAKDINLFGNSNVEEVEKVRNMVRSIVNSTGTKLPTVILNTLIEELLLDIVSLGKLHPFLIDDSVSEIMVNAPNEVWVEKGGHLHLTDVVFKNDEEVRDIANKIVSHVGRNLDQSNPYVDARLPDGSRVNIVLPPVAMKGTTISIRKFFKEKLSINNLIDFGTINEECAKFLEAAVRSRANIIVSGGTGSGKTTTLNILSNFILDGERVMTIEDSAELQLSNDHIVKFESKPPNNEGKGAVTIRTLIMIALRQRPDRIIVGEVRDGSCYDLLQACNTGHDGSMGTVHANDPDACVSRMNNLVLQAGLDLPSKFINVLIAEAIDIIVQISRLKDGSRKITHITEVVEYVPETEIVVTKDIYRWNLDHVDQKGKLHGDFAYTGYIPTQSLLDKFALSKYNFDELVNGSDT